MDRAYVLATPHMDRHAAYVGLTRHRDGVALHYAAEDFADPARLARALGRERAKDTTLDYGWKDNAERRGLDPLRPKSEIVVQRLALGGTRAELVRFTRGLKGQPGAVRVLREQGEAFGMAERPNLAQMLADPQPEWLVIGILAAAEDGMRAHLKEVAQQEIARQQEATRQQAVRAGQRPSQGMGLK